MTYLTADQIGKSAGIDDVLAVVGFMEMFGLTFYQEGQSWIMPLAPWYRKDDETIVVNIGRPVISLTAARTNTYGGLVENVDLDNSSIVAGRYLHLPIPWPTWLNPIRDWIFEGTVGIAEQVDISAGEELKVGQTIKRAGVVMMIVEDGQTAQAGDVWLKPPPLLNKEAVTIARRMDSLELDSDAVWDNDSNTIIDGFKKTLRAYR